MASREHVIKQLHLQHAAVRGTPQEAQLLARVREMMNKRKVFLQNFASAWKAFLRCVSLGSLFLVFFLIRFLS